MVGSAGEMEKGVRWRARWRLIRHLGLSLNEIDDYQKKHLLELRMIKSRADLDQLLPPNQSRA